MSRPPYSKRKVKIFPLSLNSIPSHATLSSRQKASETPPLRSFILSALEEAVSFVDDFLPKAFTKDSLPKASPPAQAEVQLMKYEDKGFKETWFARRSEHVAEEKIGTASWAEFKEGLLDDHSMHEYEYTPDVFDAHKVLEWTDEIRAITDQKGPEGGWEGYQEVVMEIYEMAHSIPPPLQNRIFPVLVIHALTPTKAPSASTAAATAKSASTETTSNTAAGAGSTTEPDASLPTSFIIVQIPLRLYGIEAAIYSSGRHRGLAGAPEKREKATLAAYVSVERVKLVDASPTPEAGGTAGGTAGNRGGKPKIVWEMATASDAKGWVPMSLQKMGVPSAVLKDVGYFIDWAYERRWRRKTNQNALGR